MILHRRSQLLKWLEGNAPTASIRRAVGEGSVEFLGWFKEIPGSKHPGWIIKIASTITPTLWHVVVRKRLDQLWYRAWVLAEPVSWQHWNPSDSENSFMYGDNPEKYQKYRREDTKA